MFYFRRGSDACQIRVSGASAGKAWRFVHFLIQLGLSQSQGQVRRDAAIRDPDGYIIEVGLASRTSLTAKRYDTGSICGDRVHSGDMKPGGFLYDKELPSVITFLLITTIRDMLWNLKSLKLLQFIFALSYF